MLRGWAAATLVSCSPGSFTPVVASTLPLMAFAFRGLPLLSTHIQIICGRNCEGRCRLKTSLFILHLKKQERGLQEAGSQPRWFRSVWIGVALSSPSHPFPFLCPSFIPPALLNKPLKVWGFLRAFEGTWPGC